MRTCVIVALALLLGGCQSAKEPDATSGAITPGTVKLTVEKGKTTQTDILNAFGPPDVVTHKDDMQVWTYDKTTYDYEQSGGYFNILIAGTGSKSAKSSSRSNFLMLYFNQADVVTDYRYNSVKY